MSLRRIAALLAKDLVHGSKSFIFIFVVVAPVAISLALSLVFGSLLGETTRLGIVDPGDSSLPSLARQTDSLEVREYAGQAELKSAVRSGAVDVGIALPAGFDSAVRNSGSVTLTAYVWGESLARQRAIAVVAISDMARQIAGRELPVDIEMSLLGDAASVSWSQRLLPLLLLLAVVMGGSMLPATSLVEERQKGTLDALTITPVTLNEVLTAKGLMGAGLSLVMALVIVLLNGGFQGQAGLLVATLALGAILAAELGLLLGMVSRDITSLFATVKAIGLLIYAPAILYLFPQVPEWVGRIFPTYYIVQPVVDIAQGSGFAEVWLELTVLLGLVMAGGAVLVPGARRLALRRA